MPDSIVRSVIREVDPIAATAPVGPAAHRVLDSGLPALPAVEEDGSFAEVEVASPALLAWRARAAAEAPLPAAFVTATAIGPEAQLRMQAALQLMAEGNAIAPAKALALGLVSALAPSRDAVLAQARAWCAAGGFRPSTPASRSW